MKQTIFNFMSIPAVPMLVAIILIELSGYLAKLITKGCDFE